MTNQERHSNLKQYYMYIKTCKYCNESYGSDKGIENNPNICPKCELKHQKQPNLSSPRASNRVKRGVR